VLTPYDFQQDAIDLISQKQGYILADECGLGKTLVSIEVAKHTRKSKNWRALVICPPTLVPQWVAATAHQDPYESVLTVNYTPYRFNDMNGWFVAHYFELHKAIILEQLCKTVWDIVIIDEAHRIKNRKTKMAKTTKAVPRVRSLLLTGTPMEHGPKDLWSLLHYADPDYFPAYWAYVTKYLIKEENWMGFWEITGPQDPEEFGKLVSPYMMRRTKEEVAPELPKRIYVLTPLQMVPAQRKVYEAVKDSDDIIVQATEDVELIIPNVLALLVRLQQIATDPSLLGIKAPSIKELWLEDFLKDHPDEPVVVFTKFRKTALRLARKHKADYIVGGERSHGFHEERFLRLFGTIDAMGEGLNLQHASICIFLDAHWSATKTTQAIDRVHRIGITKPPVIYKLTTCREDRMTWKAVEEKWTEHEFVYAYLHGETNANE